MKRGVMAALAVLMVLPAVKAVGQDRRSFACGNESSSGRQELQKRSNGLMLFVLSEYRDRWDAEYAREQCEAYANGEPHDISCLNDRRDWDAIEAMVPDKFHELSRMQIAEPLSKLREQDPFGEAMDYCERVGAIE